MNPCLSFDVSHLKNKTKTKKQERTTSRPETPELQKSKLAFQINLFTGIPVITISHAAFSERL